MLNNRLRLYIKKNGPGQYRSLADNPEKQVCYFNKPNGDVFYNTSISERIKGEEFDDGIHFKTEKVRGKTDKENFDAKRTLEDANFSMIQSQRRMEQEQKDMETISNTFTEGIGDQQD